MRGSSWTTRGCWPSTRPWTLEAIRAGLATIPLVCAGGAPAGAIGELPPRGRFRWLASPRSTMIQTSPVHTGRTADPPGALARLFDTMVKRPCA